MSIYLYPSRMNIYSLKDNKMSDLVLSLYISYLLFINYFAFGLVFKGRVDLLYSENFQILYEIADLILNLAVIGLLIKLFGNKRKYNFFSKIVIILSMFSIPIMILRFLSNVLIVFLFSFLDYSNLWVVHASTGSW